MRNLLNLKPIELTCKKCPMKDTQGFKASIGMLQASQQKVRNVDRYIQYYTIRILKSRYGTVFNTSSEAVLDQIIFKNDRGVPFRC